MGLTLVTATMPTRAAFLAQMITSVAVQTVKPAAHHVVWDDGTGLVNTVNRAAAYVDTDWWCLVDDDDLLLPRHVEVLTDHLMADIVWTWVEVQGRDWNPNQGYEPGVLAARNYIPANMAIRTELWRDLGGYQHGHRHPDWDLLQRAEAAGASFLNVPEVTWIYRFHDSNTSQSTR